MKSLVVKRSIVAAGHKTSVSLEDAFWDGLKEIARGRNITLSELVSAIDSERQHGNLSSSIRLFVLDFYRNKLADVQAGGDGPGGDFAIMPKASCRQGMRYTSHPKDGG
jgi:predicted DNA-binding ribbon-helix-helix protein